MKTQNNMEKQTTYILLDKGEVSGKAPWVYAMGTKEICSKIAIETSKSLKNIIPITDEEAKYINSINPSIELGYYEGGETPERKFFY